MGEVALNNYDLSVSHWTVLEHRLKVLDMPILVKEHYAMFLRSTAPKTDFGFFLRPFQSDLWILTLSLLILSMIAVIGVQKCHQYTDVRRCIQLSAWILFIVVNAYYGGALTMFFLSHSKVPFSNIQEALKYSEWKVTFQNGENIHLESPASLVSTLTFILASLKIECFLSARSASSALRNDFSSLLF